MALLSVCVCVCVCPGLFLIWRTLWLLRTFFKKPPSHQSPLLLLGEGGREGRGGGAKVALLTNYNYRVFWCVCGILHGTFL